MGGIASYIHTCIKHERIQLIVKMNCLVLILLFFFNFKERNLLKCFLSVKKTIRAQDIYFVCEMGSCRQQLSTDPRSLVRSFLYRSRYTPQHHVSLVLSANFHRNIHLDSYKTITTVDEISKNKPMTYTKIGMGIWN